MRIRPTFNHLLVLIVLIFAIWGPKVGGYFDLMVFVPAVVLMLWTIDGHVNAPRELYIVSVVFVLLVMVLVTIASLINDAFDFQAHLRSMRAFISVLVLVPLFFLLARRRILSQRSGFILLIISLFINTFAIYAQIIFPSLQEMMGQLWGFDKPLRDIRAFGLTAGYDSAGYLAALLAASVFATSLIFCSWKWFVFFIICVGAVGFTSRTSMLILAVLIVIVLLLNRRVLKDNIIRTLLTVAGAVMALTWYVLPIILSGILELAIVGSQENPDYTANYATTSLTDVFYQMAVLPQDLWTWMFGSGKIVSWSDIGYVKILHLGGAPLLGLMVIFYMYIYMAARSSAGRIKSANGANRIDVKWAQLWLQVLLLMMIIMMVGNLKNLYFFSRGYHELFVIIVSMIIGNYRGYGGRKPSRYETLCLGSA